MYVKGIYLNGTDDLSEVFKLRTKIFDSSETDFSNYFDIDNFEDIDNYHIDFGNIID